MRSNGLCEANCAEEKRVIGTRKQRELGSRVFQREKYSRRQSVLGDKVCYEATVTSQFKANCSFEKKLTMQRVSKQ